MDQAMRVERDGHEYFVSKRIEDARVVKHAFYGRNPGAVPRGTVIVKQVYGTNVVRIEGRPYRSRLAATEADALITNIPETPLCVLTADSIPLLMLDPVNKAIAAVNVNIRSAAEGIVTKTIAAMISAYTTDLKDLICALGPSIGPCCYTVGEETREVFEGHAVEDDIFSKTRGALNLDLRIVVMSELNSIGIDPLNITLEEICTCCHPDLFFSNRRDGSETERQINIITIVNPLFRRR